MSRVFQIVTLCVIALVIISCREPEPFFTDRGEGYYPLEAGRVLEYKVDSVIFDDAGTVNRLDTFSSFVRERTVDEFIDGEGNTVYRIQREYRKVPDDAWQVTHLWTAASNGYEAIRNEENQRLVKMEFPLYFNRRWSPTKYINTLIQVPVGTETINMYSLWEGEVLSIHQPEHIGDFAFDSVMTCQQADDDNELERRYVREKYARGIGLVFRMDTIVDSRCERIGDFGPCIGMPWIKKGEKGYIMRMELISHN